VSKTHDQLSRSDKDEERVPRKRGLGRGLGALIKETTAAGRGSDSDGGQTIRVDAIAFNPFQPRQKIEEGALEELAASVRERGVLQPLLVRRHADRVELIAGERRLRAARAAGLNEVPVIIIDASDTETLELALIENIQREDLNVVEEADAYQLLAEKYNLTQEQIADRVGKARPSVANVMRVNGLPREVRTLILAGALSAGHAKALAGVAGAKAQIELGTRAATAGLSVRALEKLIDQADRPKRKPRAQKSDLPADHLNYVHERLQGFFGAAVRLKPSQTLANGKKRRGTIEVDFDSNEELDRILDLLGLSES
jgi:ParB family chromosome partitioning protein